MSLLSAIASGVVPVGERCFLLPPRLMLFLMGDACSGRTHLFVFPALVSGRGLLKGRLPPLLCFLITSSGFSGEDAPEILPLEKFSFPGQNVATATFGQGCQTP